MNPLSSPKNKLITASLLLLALGAAASAGGLNAALLARGMMAVIAIAGMAWWFVRARGQRTGNAEAPRLEVVSRAGLSQRTALALVQVDGKPYLVVHGDGFAEICEPGAVKKQRRRRAAKRTSFKSALRSVS